MNIFWCHRNPKIAALFVMWSKHIVKMPLEAVQIAYAVYALFGGLPENKPENAYRPTHLRHPCVLWAATSLENFFWLLDHAEQLCLNYRSYKMLCIEEKTARGEKLKKTDVVRDHACLAHIEWLRSNPPPIPATGLTEGRLVINEDELPLVAVYTNGVIDVPATYRNYVKPETAEARAKRRQMDAKPIKRRPENAKTNKNKKIKLDE